MAKHGRKKHVNFPPLRKRQKVYDRRFCILWINRMVNKEVEKRIAELRSEFLLMNHALRDEMVAEIQEELRELLPEEVRERAIQYTMVDQKQRMTLRWIRRIEKQYREINEEAEEDGEHEVKPQDLEILSFSETSCDSNNRPKCKPKKSLKNKLDVSSDDDTSDGDTSDGDTSSQPAKCEQEENRPISSDVTTVAEPIQLMKGESSRTPFHATQSFMPEEPTCRERGVPVDRTKEEEALLMERQWKEWMDKQEMRGNHNKDKQIDQIQSEKQGGVAPPVLPKQNGKPNTKQTTKQKQNVKHVHTVTKIKTYFSNLLNPHTFNKWERFEDED